MVKNKSCILLYESTNYCIFDIYDWDEEPRHLIRLETKTYKGSIVSIIIGDEFPLPAIADKKMRWEEFKYEYLLTEQDVLNAISRYTKGY